TDSASDIACKRSARLRSARVDAEHEGYSPGKRVPACTAGKTHAGSAQHLFQQLQSKGARQDCAGRKTSGDTSQSQSAAETKYRRTGATTLWSKRASVRVSAGVTNSNAGSQCAAAVNQSPAQRTTRCVSKGEWRAG